MRALLALLGCGCFCSKLLGQPAGSNDLKVVWQAPTNVWPSYLWIYKVVPQTFTPVVISNLLAMASFSAANRSANYPYQPPANDKSWLYFATPDEKRRLFICPTFGYIEYRDLDAEGENFRSSIGVPTDREAYPMALDYLRRFGIDRSQLAIRPATNDFVGPTDLGIRREETRRGWNDKNTQKAVEDVFRRGIYFVRRLDGVDIDGLVNGGVFISFGERAKIAELKITWRGLEPFELRPTLTPNEIVKLVRDGYAKWRPSAQGQDSVKRITVTGFEFLYKGQPGDKDPKEQQRFVDPYLLIYASLGDGGTNDMKCYSEMPIFSSK